METDIFVCKQKFYFFVVGSILFDFHLKVLFSVEVGKYRKVS